SSFKDYYREKQQEAASTALKQPSLANGLFNLIFMSSI
ncbi:unnamed protein product, partial [Rotaria socialis]